MELRSDERVLFEGRPAWRALLSFYVLGLIVVVAAFFIVRAADASGTGVAAALVILVVVLLIGYLRRVFTKYLITTQRLRISRGLIARKVQEARLDRVQNVNYDQGVIDRMFNVGNVDFDTAGTDDAEFRFAWVARPEEVVRAVDQAHAERASSREA